MDNQNIEILYVNSSLENFFVLLARIFSLHRLIAPSSRKEARITRHKRSTLKSTVCQRQMEHHQTCDFVMWPHSCWSLSFLKHIPDRVHERQSGNNRCNGHIPSQSQQEQWNYSYHHVQNGVVSNHPSVSVGIAGSFVTRSANMYSRNNFILQIKSATYFG